MRKSNILSLLLFSILSFTAFSQDGVNIEGYVYEEGNRGYLNLAKVTIIDAETGDEKGLASTDKDGVFLSILPADKVYVVIVEKDLFTTVNKEFSTVGKKNGEKVFIKIKMNRKPGYIFDVTLAEKRASDTITVDAITGATIEVFNNTTGKEELRLIDHPTQSFKAHFIDGSHYTVLIRKKGYFNKRMEAFVNVKGCILCFEGVGEIKPSDVLSEGNTMGTLVANVSLEPIKMDEGIRIENIYYDYDKSIITELAANELDKLINVLNINPALVVELGSHTDSRGDDDYNFDLSSKRAKAAVDYILANSEIKDYRIRYQGYGETKLVNKCGNSSNCSEKDHAINRRTELKVVGLLDIDPLKDKSLQEIIELENFNKLLEEIQNQEQVRVEPGNEVPDFVQKQEKEKEQNITEEAAKMADHESPLPAEVEEVEEVVEIKKSDVLVEEKLAQKAKEEMEVITEVRKTVDEKKEEEIVEPQPKINLEEIAEVKEDLKEEVVKAETIKEIVVEKPVVLVTENKIFAQKSIDTPKPTQRPTSLPLGYTGYRVEFYSSPFELPGSHEIFYRHGKITIDQKNDGSFSYLLGAFNELSDAQDFLDNIIIQQYPTAKVIRYKKGNRING